MRLCAILLLLFAGTLSAQQSSSNARDVTCTFADGKGVRVQYDYSEKPKKPLPNGKTWTPAGKPLLLFLDTPVEIGNSMIPLGAYDMVVVPGKADWTLEVDKAANDGTKGNASQVLAQTTMQTGQLNGGEDTATVYMAHIAPRQCNIRIVYGKTMAWGEMHEK